MRTHKLMKRIGGVILAILCCIAISAFAVASSTEMIIDENCGPDTYPLNNNPEVLYEDNLDILTAVAQNNRDASSASVVGMNDILNVADVEAAGGEIVSVEYTTYNDFLTQISTMESRSTQVGDNRVVLVVEIYYPNGFEHVKAGIIENCLATGIYDAATGEYLGGEYTTVDGDYIN